MNPQTSKFLVSASLLFALTLSGCSPATLPAPTPIPATETLQPTLTPLPPTSQPPTATPQGIASHLNKLNGVPCPKENDSDPDFICVTLPMPLDHFDASNKNTLEVTFAVLPATRPSRGILMALNGGPGSSGINVAATYAEIFGRDITSNFDLVTFDPRGLGLSGGINCPRAAQVYYDAPFNSLTAEGEAALLQTAQTYATDCPAETGHADWLPYLGTVQAAEDIETFRQAIGVEKFTLYGESYGTQLAQQYALTHPDRLNGLILDGIVDPTFSSLDFTRESIQVSNDILQMTLAACDKDAACAADMGGSASTAFASLLKKLRAGALKFQFPLPDGTLAERSLTQPNVEAAILTYLNPESARRLLIRALAAASQGNYVPLARIYYESQGLDPQTNSPQPLGGTFSDALHFSVECRDYAFFEGAPDERAQAFLRFGDEHEKTLFFSDFYDNLPCVYWPAAQTDPTRPAYLSNLPFPTLVLTATGDPITPVANARRVFERLGQNAFLFTTEGGRHVTFGRGKTCPDDYVIDFILTGKTPAQPETTCPGTVYKTYPPLSPRDASNFANPLEAMLALDKELYYLPEYYFWNLSETVSVGCDFGGYIDLAPNGNQEAYTFANCALSQGFIVNGTGLYNPKTGKRTYTLTLSGLADGKFTYKYDEQTSKASLVGTYKGQPVELSK